MYLKTAGHWSLTPVVWIFEPRNIWIKGETGYEGEPECLTLATGSLMSGFIPEEITLTQNLDDLIMNLRLFFRPLFDSTGVNRCKNSACAFFFHQEVQNQKTRLEIKSTRIDETLIVFS